MATVGELLESVLPRLSGTGQNISFLDAIQATIDVIVRRLLFDRSDLIVANMRPIVFVSGVSTQRLPYDFLGLTEHPSVVMDGSVAKLSPLPSDLRYSFTQNGIPSYYEIIGRKITLFPVPDKECQLKGMYFQDPPKLESLEDDVPFDGVFDQLIKDAVLQIGSSGILIVNTQAFESIVHNHIDRVIIMRNPKSVKFFFNL